MRVFDVDRRRSVSIAEVDVDSNVASELGADTRANRCDQEE